MTQREQDQDLVGELLDIEYGLSDSAIEFIESLDRWLETSATLTLKQREKAQQVRDEWTCKHR